jgi:hypothetical protein
MKHPFIHSSNPVKLSLKLKCSLVSKNSCKTVLSRNVTANQPTNTNTNNNKQQQQQQQQTTTSTNKNTKTSKYYSKYNKIKYPFLTFLTTVSRV